jgi:hypothetical protein
MIGWGSNGGIAFHRSERNGKVFTGWVPFSDFRFCFGIDAGLIPIVVWFWINTLSVFGYYLVNNYQLL